MSSLPLDVLHAGVCVRVLKLYHAPAHTAKREGRTVLQVDADVFVPGAPAWKPRALEIANTNADTDVGPTGLNKAVAVLLHFLVHNFSDAAVNDWRPEQSTKFAACHLFGLDPDRARTKVGTKAADFRPEDVAADVAAALQRQRA